VRKIFISYRRSEAEYAAGALGRALREHFGVDRVFRDKEDIGAGVSWKQQIAAEIGPDAALLVLIGKDWCKAGDPQGRNRLDNADDPIRMEISGGLARGATIIPVLLENAVMPEEKDLPADLKPLCEHNAVKLRDGDWQYDLERIFKMLEKAGFAPATQKTTDTASAPAPAPARAAAAQPGISTKGIIAAVLVTLVTVAFATETLDHDAHVGALAISLVALVLSLLAAWDLKRGAVRGRILVIIVATLSVLDLLGSAGGLSEKSSGAPAVAAAPAPHNTAGLTATDAPVTAPPAITQDAPQSALESVATAANQRAPANRAGSRPASSVAGRWQDADEGTAIVFSHEGNQVSMIATQQGVTVEGHGTFSGQRMALVLSMAGVPIGELHLTLSPDGRHLQGNMLVQGSNEAVHFIR
jgi:TIR domain